MNLRKILYVTGTRADYGLMRELLKKLDADDDIDLSICVTGMHLSKLYGHTIDEIHADKFKVCGVIPVDVVHTSKATMVTSIGHEIIGMTEVFEREKPDFILLLGDRGEMLAAAITAVCKQDVEVPPSLSQKSDAVYKIEISERLLILFKRNLE